MLLEFFKFDLRYQLRQPLLWVSGLILGLMRGYDLPTCGRMASLMGALKVEHPGTQNQRFTYDEFAAQFRQQFGYAL